MCAGAGKLFCLRVGFEKNLYIFAIPNAKIEILGQENYALMQDEDFVGKGGLGVLYEIISQEQLDAGQIPQTRA